MKPFTTDGCSGGMSWAWRTFLRRPPPWENGCVRHDKHYWRGGTASQRRCADRELLWYVEARGYPIIALAMYWAIRVGGHPLLPFPWRWGYGHRYPRKYDRRTTGNELR